MTHEVADDVSAGSQTTVTFAELYERVEAIFRSAGLSAEQSGPIARMIAAGERDGAASHGIYRIDGCLRTIRAGKVDRTAVPELEDDGSAVIKVAAHDGFSGAALEVGVPVLAERARQLGLASLVIHDAAHFSALWYDVESLTELGLAALALCPSYTAVAPAGGREPLLGTNPIAFGWPRPGKAPYVFDFATSMAARGEVELHLRAGTPLPDGWAIDSDGQPTTDPEAALAGALLPFGGHKGSAISIMIELLGGIMIGDLTSPESLANMGTEARIPSHGELILAFDPERFAGGRPGNQAQRAEVLFDAILGQGARLPGQRRHAARERSLAEGITLTADEVEQLDRFETLGLEAVAE